VRLFVAVDPGERFRAAATSLLDDWRRRWDLKWARSENLHVTLRFIGEQAADRGPGLVRAVEQGVRGYRSFPVQADGLGVFPDWKRPRVLFLQLHDGGGLSELARSVSARIDAACPDAVAPTGVFRAHLTLARFHRNVDAAAMTELRALDAPRLPGFTVDEVRLMASELRPAGARYAVQGVFPLARG